MKMFSPLSWKSSRVILLAVAGCLLAGCSTIKSRIEEKSAVFAPLPPAVQEKIRKGIVEIGYTTDMVYMALGSPDEHRERETKHGRNLTWIYTTIDREYMGTANVGYRRIYVRDPHSGATAVYLEPVYTDVYRDEERERIRVIFEQGKVAAIELEKK